MASVEHTRSLDQALALAWNEDMARSSMDRWQSLCEQNNWQHCPDNTALLATLFGASWYFTRFVFFRGCDVARFFDGAGKLDFTTASLIEEFLELSAGDDEETQLEALKVAKNEIMLSILLAQLSKTHEQAEIERALSRLAEATLNCAIQILSRDDEVKNNMAILAMGRMAGGEMNFGSDLDLIFLYSGDSQELGYKISAFVRKLMRNIGLLSPAGLLYEVDMRLRPHGSSGVLVIGEQSFVDYHRAERETWERQMMTRCRTVFDNNNLASSALEKIESCVYQKFDGKKIAADILEMRQLVIDELVSQRGKYDLKRGEGGIMDIDFLSHYLQLLHGSADESLRTASTREALGRLTVSGKLAKNKSEKLLSAYNFLKMIEGHLRIFDMKSISTFSKEVDKLNSLVRSMGYVDEDVESSVNKFIDDYQATTQGVRQIFNDVLDHV